jgi:hypothetical protein
VLDRLGTALEWLELGGTGHRARAEKGVHAEDQADQADRGNQVQKEGGVGGHVWNQSAATIDTLRARACPRKTRMAAATCIALNPCTPSQPRMPWM